ncbi:MAG: lytic transglycosylase domain-containing protein [Acetobacteraceae bacterium]|nr:lytic transglycosylase domain-containing protein [Acetobacteraceae bacterium]
MIPAALLACALNVHPVTLEAVIRVESGGRADAVNHNRDGTRDFGLMQVNERHLREFGVTVQEVMDPCTNVRIGGAILAANYARAVQTYGEGQRALQAALSAYNTGDFARGFANGYVARYYGHSIPALPAGVQLAAAHSAAPVASDPYTAPTAVRAIAAPVPSSRHFDPYTAPTAIATWEAVNVRTE